MAYLSVKVQPRASRTEIAGFDAGGILRVRVTAPPADGKANDAVIHLLAETLRVAPSRITLVRGATARLKMFAIEGLTDDEIRARLAST